MKSPKLTSLLLGVTAVSAILSILLVGAVHQGAKAMRQLQMQLVFINQTQPMINSLAMELRAYSERNPAINPILYAAKIKLPPGATPTNPPPAARPAR
jgi:hypothetical protein